MAAGVTSTYVLLNVFDVGCRKQLLCLSSIPDVAFFVHKALIHIFLIHKVRVYSVLYRSDQLTPRCMYSWRFPTLVPSSMRHWPLTLPEVIFKLASIAVGSPVVCTRREEIFASRVSREVRVLRSNEGWLAPLWKASGYLGLLNQLRVYAAKNRTCSRFSSDRLRIWSFPANTTASGNSCYRTGLHNNLYHSDKFSSTMVDSPALISPFVGVFCQTKLLISSHIYR